MFALVCTGTTCLVLLASLLCLTGICPGHPGMNAPLDSIHTHGHRARDERNVNTYPQDFYCYTAREVQKLQHWTSHKHAHTLFVLCWMDESMNQGSGNSPSLTLRRCDSWTRAAIFSLDQSTSAFQGQRWRFFVLVFFFFGTTNSSLSADKNPG